MTVAEVAVDKTADKTFSYLVPDHLKAMAGTRVRVPFRTTERTGTVVAVQERASARPLRPLLAVLAEEGISEAQVDLASFLVDHYLNHMPQAISALLPPPLAAVRGHWRLLITSQAADLEAKRLTAKAPRRSDLLGRMAVGEQPRPGESHLARTLATAGLIAWEVGASDHSQKAQSTPAAGHRLTAAQERAVQRLAGGGQSLLLGVTGSGKTEVYLEAMAQRLALGQSACLLVPEIALTPQLVARVRERFGDMVAVWHSRLSSAERSRAHQTIASGQARVVVGARSAVFVPMSDLGLVILDECHETSFQQEESPRYHAQDVARFRLQASDGRLLLGSATPDVVDFHRALAGDLDLLTLDQRFGPPLPQIEMVDLRRFGRTPLSLPLLEALRATLARGEQAILFLNRRGFHPLVLCRDCGFALRCPHCQVAMVIHLPDRDAVCHACGYVQRPPSRCPQCQGDHLQPLGLGTQRLEAMVAEALPAARIVRLDQDSARQRGAYEAIHQAVLSHRADILIGTQMVAKGFDFPDVSLVGVVLADQALHFPDYRAAERTFQLVAQAAGRSGRRQQGQVIVQSFDPSHYALQAAAGHDYRGFASQELAFRQEAVYPPFTRLLLVGVSAEDEALARSGAQKAADLLRQDPELTVLGPSPALRSKVRDRWRMQVLVKHQDRTRLLEAGRQVQELSWPAALRLGLAIDPLSIL